MENPTNLKARITDPTRKYEEKEVIQYRTQLPDDVASFAMHCIERWGLVAAVPDGEDSAGRAMQRLPTPDELVTRAFDIAEKVFEVTTSRGHMLTLPDLNEVNAERDARLAEAEQKRKAEREARAA